MKTKSDILIERLIMRVAQHPFLAGLNREQLSVLTECAMATHFKEGQTILQQGEYANRFYLVASGAASLESRARQVNES